MTDPWVTPVDLAANPDSHEARIRALEEDVRRIATKGINVESLSELSSELGTVSGDRLVLGSRDDGWRLEASGLSGWSSGFAGQNNCVIGSVEQILVRYVGGEGGGGTVPAGGQLVLGSVGDGASGGVADERFGRISFAASPDGTSLIVGAQLCGYPGGLWSSGVYPTGIFLETRITSTMAKRWQVSPAGAGSYLYSLYVGQIASAAEDCIVADGYVWAKGDGASYGILIGTDTVLYRSAANTLATPDTITIRTDGASATPTFSFVRSDTGASLWDFYSTYSDITKIDNNVWYANAADADHINLTSISTQCGNNLGIYAISQMKAYNLHEAGPNNYNAIGVIRGESSGDYGCAYVTRKGLRIFSAIPPTLVGVDVAAGNLVVDGTLSVGGYVLTVPATGTAALGTGTQYYLPVWTGTNTLGALASLGSANAILSSAGAGANPAWSAFFLTGTAGGTTTFAVTNTKTLTLTATDSYNLTIPATGTAALHGVANTFTVGPQTIQTGADANRGLVIKQNSATQSANLLTFTTSGTTVIGAVAADGKMGVGANTSATDILYITGTWTDFTANRTTVNSTGYCNPGSDIGSPYTFYSQLTNAYKIGTYNMYAMVANSAYAILAAASGTLSYASVYSGGISFSGATNAGVITTGYTFVARTPSRSSGNTGTITSQYGMYIGSQSASFVTNAYGLLIESITGSTVNVAIRTYEGTVTFNYSSGPEADFRVNGDTYSLIETDSSADAVYLAKNAAAKLSFFAATPIARVTALTGGLTVITHTAPGTPDYAIQDFVDVALGAGWAFANHDEANSVLKALANVQTRLDELEDKLGHTAGYGLLNH